MPSGNTHAKASLIMTLPVLMVASLSGSMEFALSAVFGCFIGIMLTPDLDQESISSSEYWLIKWTFGLGFLWTMLWYPYARVCKHRSMYSHYPVIGTILRLAYLTLFYIIFAAFGLVAPLPPFLVILGISCGLAVSDTIHWLMDLYWKENLVTCKR